MIYKHNGSIITDIGGKWLSHSDTPTPPEPDYNPLNLPPNTVRVRTSDGHQPDKSASSSYETATLVAGTTDVYDVYKSGTSLAGMFLMSTNVIEVLGANTSGITNMQDMFRNCNLITVPLFDTSSVTNMKEMFMECPYLTKVPLLDTSNVTNMDDMFYNSLYIESGALALYQQASSQAIPPNRHNQTFHNCGSSTVTGAAELAQIPSSWGGTGV